MKINDKHLTTLAVGNCPSDKEGFLMKRGEVNKAFQKRWFTLKGNLLFYFEKKGDKEPIGVIILEGCTVELAESPDAYTFECVFPGSSSRTYVLAAESQEEMEEWMKAISCAGYDYMKLMVSEMQRQLDEINLAQVGKPTWRKSAIVEEGGEGGCTGGAGNSTTSASTLLHQGSTSLPQDQRVGQLIDLDSPSRVNPFNKAAPCATQSLTLDMFGAVPFNPEVLEDKAGRPRGFAEMHTDFGKEIHKKADDRGTCLSMYDTPATIQPSS